MILKTDDMLFFAIFFDLQHSGFEPEAKSICLEFTRGDALVYDSVLVDFFDLETNRQTLVNYNLNHEGIITVLRTGEVAERTIEISTITIRRRIEDTLRKMSPEEQGRVLPTLAQALGVKLSS